MYTVTAVMIDKCALEQTIEWSRLSDEECVACVQQGDNDAFSELVRRYQGRIHRYVLRMIGCPEDALDITQDTFVNAYRHLGKWQPQALFRTWLFRIASNAATDYLRRNKLWNCVPIDELSHSLEAGCDLERQHDAAARCATMIQLIEELPPLFRQALLLRELEGLSYAEIAQALDLNEGTVKSRISRARSSLMAGLERAGNHRD